MVEANHTLHLAQLRARLFATLAHLIQPVWNLS